MEDSILMEFHRHQEEFLRLRLLLILMQMEFCMFLQKIKAQVKNKVFELLHQAVLSKDEIEKMKNDAKEHAAEDKKRKKKLKLKIKRIILVFQTKKQIEEMKDKISADSKI